MDPKSEGADSSFLSPSAYDDDASSLRSPSNQDSDSEDDEYLEQTRTTQELAQHDRAVLDDEEETENLLTRGGPTHGLRRIFSPHRGSVRIGKRDRRRQKKPRRESRTGWNGAGEESELMFEMEEGYRDDSSEPSELDGMEKYEYTYSQVLLPRRDWWAELTSPA